MSDSRPKINLLVLRSADIERAVSFYTALGMSFVSEKHGEGPTHYSATIDGLVLEIYPQIMGTPVAPIRFGIAVDSLDTTVRSLEVVGGSCVQQPHASKWGRRAVIKDCDGHVVELSE